MKRGRPKKQVNKVAVRNLEVILDELKAKQGITQEAFGEAINTSQQNVSKLKTGETDLDVDYALAIERAYPQYRAAGILGLDEYLYREEYEKHERDVFRSQEDAFMVLLGALSEFSSYGLMGITRLVSGEERFAGDNPMADVEHALMVSIDGVNSQISADKLEQLRHEIGDFIDFKLSRMINR